MKDLVLWVTCDQATLFGPAGVAQCIPMDVDSLIPVVQCFEEVPGGLTYHYKVSYYPENIPQEVNDHC